MAQFQVPQFIETEDKIIGPLTLRQFLYLGIAGLTSFFLFFIFQFWLWLMVTAILGIAAAALAFIKYNGRPLISILSSALKYLWQPRLYLWKSQQTAAPGIAIPNIPEIEKESPLKKLFLDLTTAVKFRRKSESQTEEYKKATAEKQKARRINFQ